ncbi:unnamed protein product [Agarophyton chilense]
MSASASHKRALASALLIIALLASRPRRPRPSLFRLRREPRPRYRRVESAPPHARVCSSTARTHFNSRFTRFSRALHPVSAHTIQQSKNRVFMSSLPREVGDGLGHRSCLLNYERVMALVLGLSYSHRVSTYGSLSVRDEHAVERLFGWGDGELKRHDLLDRACLQVAYVNDSCETPASHVVCRRVLPRRRGGVFDQTVIIPDAVSDCLLVHGDDGEQQCGALFRSFVSAYGEPNTLFQMRPRRCFREYLYTNFSRTRDWFAHKYWHRDASKTRQLALERERVHIAMHVRRGDFFNYSERVLIPDATFVDVAGRIRMALDDMLGRRALLTVHIFSEGVSVSGERVKDNHDTSKMEAVYVDERGVRRDAKHWQRLFERHARWRGRDGLVVRTHIASDTIEAVHMMAACDFFIGSVSGLSAQVVRHLGRGLLLLPLHQLELLRHEHAVLYDLARHGFDSFLRERQLYALLNHTVRRNRLACAAW